ncbi:MAG: hypothetical protein HQ523_03965 [Lentisphaerae bacterium]|nr:hypothetical protein [Lentisphaerota bacterium]
MWLRLAGIGFWLLTIVVVLRLVYLPGRGRPTKGRPVMWLVLLALACAILFRPHENILGGHDAAAYLNLGARAGYAPTLGFTDELMGQLPAQARADFLYYGHTRPYLSKYACGSVKDLAQARHGPWFQVAPTLVLSIASWLGGPSLALYVIPLFALFVALALRALAASLIDHPWAGPLAFLFYLSQPLVAWHGRCVRPEVIASFLIVAGGVLLLHAGRRARWRRTPDLLLGAICLSLAPCFHITAWMVLLPVAFLVGCALLAGRDDFLLYPIIQYAGLALFVWQTFTLADPYSLTRLIRPCLTPLYTVLLPIAAVGVLFALGLWAKRTAIWPRMAARVKGPRLFPPLLAGAILVATTVCMVWARASRPVISVEPATRYLYRTDLLAVANMVSTPTLLLGLVGLLALALKRKRYPLYSWAVLIALVPASLTIGNLYDFFMTRYMLVALLPLLALSLTACVALVPARSHLTRALLLAASVLVLAVNLHGRTHLITRTEYKGLTHYLAQVTRPIKADGGIMLAEYPQLAAPMDLAFAVPTLALHNERDRDYQRALAGWRLIMQRAPSRAAYFVTPFENPPYDEHIRFDYVDASDYMGYRLLDNYWELPYKTAPWGCRLTRYRMTLRDESAAPSPSDFPYTVTFDAGNMGASNFGQVEEFEMTATGRWVTPGHDLDMPLATTAALPGPAVVWVIALHPKGVSSSALTVRLGSGSVPTRATRLRGAWWLYRAELPGEWDATPALALQTAAPLLVSTVRLVNGRQVQSLFDGWALTERDQESAGEVRTRWAPPGATVRLPAAGRDECYACVLLAGPEELADELMVRVTTPQGAGTPHRIATGIWFWDVWAVTPPPRGNSMQLEVEAETLDGAKTPLILESIVVLNDSGAT